MKHTRNKLRPLAALVLVFGLLFLGTPAGASEPQLSEAEVEFLEWYNADPANQAFFEWLVFMQDPANAAWFQWYITAPSAKSTEQIIAEVFGASYATAIRVARCESGLDPNAVSPTNDHGVFQINSPTWNKPWHSDPVAYFIGNHWNHVYDPYTNTVMAKKIVDHYGWYMWSCY